MVGGQPSSLRNGLAERHGATCLQRHPVVAGSALDVVKRQRHAATVAGCQEARQHDIGRHGVAHEQPVLGRTYPGLGIGDGHQSELADEVGDLQRDLGLAVGIELHRSAEQGNGAGRHDIEAADLAGIAAGPDTAEVVGASVEQASVIIAHGDAELALAEVEVGRVGRAEAGELQDAFVDRRERDERLFAAEVGDAHRHLDALPRRDLLGRADLDTERAQGRIEPEPGRPDGAGRCAVGGNRQRPPGRDQRIGAGAPFGLHWNLDGRAAGGQRHSIGRHDAVGGDGDQRFAGERRLDAQPGGVARCVVLLVARDA